MKQILTVFFFLSFSYSYSQIKIFPSGTISMGSTSTPVFGKVQIFGNALLSTSSGTITSAALIKANSNYSTVSDPDYTWYGELNTGIFHPLQAVGVSVLGVEKWRFTSGITMSYGGVKFANTTTGYSTSAYIRGNNSNSSSTTPDYTWTSDPTTGFFHQTNFTIGVSINGTEKARFAPDGSLLLNNTTSTERLSVHGSTNQGVCAFVANHTNDWIYAVSTYNNNQTTKNYVVSLNGTEKFYVQGNGDAYTRSVILTSDIRLKKDIDTIQNALSKILQLRPVSYRFKDDDNGNGNANGNGNGNSSRKSIGLIAQEVENIVPEVVRTKEDGYKGIEYANLVVLLIEALKEEHSKVLNLESRIQLLENQ